ncbi:MAG: pseudouridine synthase, partial [Oscillospiraceae bacterium]|nr:pseudouridine synthase [Oscillospiraceae bacterium]
MMRLQKYLAHCGVASRRKCEEMIAAGHVAVNGAVITEMGTQVEPGDTVTV